MQIIKTKIGIQAQISFLKQQRKIIGFVPTMGYLHDGHLSLIKLAARDCDVVIVSIFVNPLQFGSNEDFITYPCDINSDIELCSKNAVDILYIPDVDDMLGNVCTLHTYINMKTLDQHMCGAQRPGHFQGVCTIVGKFFNIISPDYAYFGKKDIQQLRIIERMTSDLEFKVKIIGGDICRDENGLALSSRNSYLNGRERTDALIIYQALQLMQELIKQGLNNSDELIVKAQKLILDSQIPNLKLNYIEIVDNDSLQPVDQINKSAIIAIALFINKIRLIDNMIIEKVN